MITKDQKKNIHSGETIKSFLFQVVDYLVESLWHKVVEMYRKDPNHRE